MNIKKEALKVGLVGGLVSGILSFLISYFWSALPTDAISHGIGSSITGFLSAFCNGALGIWLVFRSFKDDAQK